MTLALLLTHLIGAIAGATLLWLSRRLLAQRMRPPQQRADAEPQIEQLREHAAHVQTLIERLSMATQAADICSWEVDLQAQRFLWIENQLPGVQVSADDPDSLQRHCERVHPEDRTSCDEMVAHAVQNKLDRTQNDYAQTIRASADSLMTVMNDILDFSRIETGKLAIETRELRMRDSVEDVARIMGFQAAAKQLELLVRVQPDVPERVIGDPQRLRQCLMNLVANAVKFTRSGAITIEVRNAGRRDGRVLAQFEVRDTGIGVAPERLALLFQPFVQADSSNTRRYGGTGLGLSIVRRLVEMMGGEVGARSELGKGSSFWFAVPLEPAADCAAEALQPGRINRGGADVDDEDRNRPAFGRANAHRYACNVLLVEDNAVNQKVAVRFLERMGCKVRVADNGEQGVRAHREGCYELVLMDLQMPVMDGLTATRQIRELEGAGKRTLIVALTANATAGSWSAAWKRA